MGVFAWDEVYLLALPSCGGGNMVSSSFANARYCLYGTNMHRRYCFVTAPLVELIFGVTGNVNTSDARCTTQHTISIDNHQVRPGTTYSSEHVLLELVVEQGLLVDGGPFPACPFLTSTSTSGAAPVLRKAVR